jgi:hypothetical protein
MKATEVLKRYEAGERDFRRVNLRGQSFKGENLSGANFSEADIRGTNFTNAKLIGTNFSGAKAGLQRRWAILLVGISLLLSALSGNAASEATVALSFLFGNLSNVLLADWFSGLVTLVTLVLVALALTIIAVGILTTVSVNTNVSLPIAKAMAMVVAVLVAVVSFILSFIEAETRHSQDIKEITIAALMNNPLINLTNEIKTENKAMSDSTDQSRKIENRDGSVTGNILGDSGTISGTVAETINQLPPSPESNKPGIKELLSQLQAAINDPNLADDDKTQALEQIKVLAEAGQNPNNEAAQKQAKRAMGFLKVIAEGLPSAAQLVKTCQDVLPAIAHFFGM